MTDPISRLDGLRRWLRLRQKALYRWAHVVFPLLLLIVAVQLRMGQHQWVAWVQQKSFDIFQNLKPRPYEAVPVRIIDLDDESLSRVGQWPWPRTKLAELITKLDRMGVAVVAFDAVFSEPDRTSPARAVEDWPKSAELEGLRAKAKSLADHDKVFADAIARTRIVLGFPLTADKNDVEPAVKLTVNVSGHNPLSFLTDYPGAVRNLPILEKAAKGDGNFGFSAENDGVIRRVPLIFRKGTTLYPSLSVEALRVAQGLGAISVKTSGSSGQNDFGEAEGLRAIKVGQAIVPTDPQGRFWVYFTAEAPGRVIPAWRVLYDKRFDAKQLDGAICFLGTSAAGLKDLRSTPLNPAAAGVEVHANVVEQILTGNLLKRPATAMIYETFYMIAFGLALLILLPRVGAAWCAVVGAGGIGAAIYLSWRAFAAKGLLLDPIFPSLTVLFIYMSSSMISYLKSEHERRQVKAQFSRYLAPAMVEQLAKHPEKLQLGGEARQMTFHFCDIRGFTTISEQFDPHGLTKFINGFLTPMTDLILAHQGTIDKYMGDCIMAFWNAPLDDPDHAKHACQAALAMHKRLDELNEKWEAEAKAAGRKYLPIHIGTGLNTGPCVVGNMGSDQFFGYSVLGDDVNLASRLEGQSKTYGAKIVVGPLTKDLAAEDFAFLELDLIKVKGKTKPVRIFTLLGGAEMKTDSKFQELDGEHQKMLSAYRHKNWDHARELIDKCKTFPFKLEKLYHLYEERIAVYREQPPAADWDGSFTATTK